MKPATIKYVSWITAGCFILLAAGLFFDSGRKSRLLDSSTATNGQSNAENSHSIGLSPATKSQRHGVTITPDPRDKITAALQEFAIRSESESAQTLEYWIDDNGYCTVYHLQPPNPDEFSKLREHWTSAASNQFDAGEHFDQAAASRGLENDMERIVYVKIPIDQKSETTVVEVFLPEGSSIEHQGFRSGDLKFENARMRTRKIQAHLIATDRWRYAHLQRPDFKPNQE